MIFSEYKNKTVDKELAISLAIKFAMKERIFHEFIEEIKKFKPYRLGNDVPRFVMKYAVGYESTVRSTLEYLFELPNINYEWDLAKKTKWFVINQKWFELVGKLRVKCLWQ